MSQHIFRSRQNNIELEVTLGHLATGNYLYMIVTAKADDGELQVRYSNEDDRRALCDLTDVQHYRGVLKHLGLTVPASMFDATMQDQAAAGSNRMLIHSFDAPPIEV